MWRRLTIVIGFLCFGSSGLWAQGGLTILHPLEGAQLPALKQVFVYGAAPVGSTVTINGQPLTTHPKGGYLVMAPVVPGANLLTLEAVISASETLKVERHFTVAEGFNPSPMTPLTLEKGSLEPAADLWVVPGDTLRVSAQGSPKAAAEFSVGKMKRHIPMADVSSNGHGLYEGRYVIQPGDAADDARVDILLSRNGHEVKEKSPGRIRIETGAVPRVGLVKDDVVAVRTGPGAGYDLFLYKGMKVKLTGKAGKEWRVQLSAIQSGWVKEEAIQELPRGTLPPQSVLSNMTMSAQTDGTLLRVPLDAVLAYRVDQSLDPMLLTITLYGAVDKTDLIRYDPADTLIRQVRWKQVTPDTCQILIQPKFKKWWGFDVRYEGTTLIVDIRRPWTSTDLTGLVIAVDPGHGGSERGTQGPLGNWEKDVNLAVARVVRDTLAKAGAKPFLTRDTDMDVPLYQRPVLAAKQGAQLFVSIHCNASGVFENPVLNNGFSTYSYQPQSLALESAVHAQYVKLLPTLSDHGLYFADFAVCRTTLMPAILTEQAFLIVPEQEQLLIDPVFHHTVAKAILAGIRDFLK